MRYLLRDGAPLTEGQWDNIDKAVVGEASRTLVGRRMLEVKLFGARTQNVPMDQVEHAEKAGADYWARGDSETAKVVGRRFLELATVYSDFNISWRDVEDEASAGVQAARNAAFLAACREDDLIFHGDAELGIDGLFSVKGCHQLALSNWAEGENPVRDLSAGLEMLADCGSTGSYALVLATDLYGKLHRLQAGTGMMEIDRVRGLVGKVYRSTRLAKNTACLVCNEPQYLDLAVGQDMITAYMGNEKMDHVFRVMETLAPRIKCPQAIVTYR